MNVAHMPVNYSNCMTWARVFFFRERGAVDMRMTNFVYYFSRYFFVCFLFRNYQLSLFFLSQYVRLSVILSFRQSIKLVSRAVSHPFAPMKG